MKKKFDGVNTDYSKYLSLFEVALQASTRENTSELLPRKDEEIITDRTHLLRQFLDYHAGPSHHTNKTQEIGYLFERFVSTLPSERGLKLQFGSSSTLLLDEQWIVVDLAPIETTSLAGMDITLEFQDEEFDRILCLDLDRISHPDKLVAELRRVLKRGGQLWGQAPVVSNQQPNTGLRYWGFTPAGLRVLFERFDEIRCSIYHARGRRDSFYYGLKPEIPYESRQPWL